MSVWEPLRLSEPQLEVRVSCLLPAPALTGSYYVFLHQFLREHWLSNSALSWVLDSAGEAEAKVPALKMQDTHLTDDCMIQTPRATGAQGREQQHMQDRMGWFKEEVAVQEEASPEIISLSDMPHLVFPCLGLWSLLSTAKKVLPVFDAKYSELRKWTLKVSTTLFPVSGAGFWIIIAG